jgi:hypothetical protein
MPITFTSKKEPETVRARVRGYGCEYTPGTLTVRNDGHKWKNGILVGTLVVQLEYTRSLKTIQNIQKVPGKQYGQEEEPTVNEIKELMADLAKAYPLLEELNVDKVTVRHEEKDGEKVIERWKHMYLEISPVQSVDMTKPLRVSMKDLVEKMSDAVPDNTGENLAPSKTVVRPGGKKARKAAAAALQEEAKS